MAITHGKILGALLALLLTGAAGAKAFTPALVYFGDKQDMGMNRMAYQGAERFKKDFGGRVIEIQGSLNEAQNMQAIRAAARRAPDMIVAVGIPFIHPVETVAREYPAIRFVLIDAVTRGGNVENILFLDQEGAFLVGMVAAMKSRTRTIGFIGGMGVPIIHAFGCGYLQGARFVDPEIRMIQNMASNSRAGFIDPARGVELARSQFERGVDVVFAAAHYTSLGVLQHASDAGKFSIGVDSNQNYRHPGSVLTSLVKRIDNVVYDALKAGLQGTWKPGMTTLGLKQRALDWTIDQHNRALITPAMERRVNAARDDIIAGKIKVVDFRAQHRCPVN